MSPYTILWITRIQFDLHEIIDLRGTMNDDVNDQIEVYGRSVIFNKEKREKSNAQSSQRA